MFRLATRRDARAATDARPDPDGQPTPDDRPTPDGRSDRSGRGRHHRSHLRRERSEARDASERIARAQRRASQVGATTPVAGTPALRTPTDGTPVQVGTAPSEPGPPGTSSGRFVFDNAVARRDPLTRPLPSAPGLPGARRSPDARRTVAGAGAL